MTENTICECCLDEIIFVGRDKNGTHFRLPEPIADGDLILIPRGFPKLHFECAKELGLK